MQDLDTVFEKGHPFYKEHVSKEMASAYDKKQFLRLYRTLQDLRNNVLEKTVGKNSEELSKLTAELRIRLI